MHRLALAILILSLTAIGGCTSRAAPPSDSPEPIGTTPPQPDQLWLVVELDDLYNHDFVVTIPIRPGESFDQTVSNGRVRNTMRGRVGRAVRNRYPVSAEVIVQPPAPAERITDALQVNLRPAEPSAGGPVGTLGISRVVTLLSLPPDADPALVYSELPKPRTRVTPPQLPPRARAR